MEHTTICSECGTENESTYEYCKNCGAPLLRATTEAQTPPSYTPSYPHGSANDQNPQNQSSLPPYYSYTGSDGIPAEDLALFVGKKADVFLPKFMEMSFSNSKVSWCWPVAVLGFFLGPIGASFWFFYRKMFKPALILFAIGLCLNFATAAMTYFTAPESAVLTIDPESDVIDSLYSYLKEIAAQESSVWQLAANLLEKTASIATCVITGIFGMYLYKSHCIAKISAYRESGIDMRYYKMGLAALGGTSGGFLALSIVSFLFLGNLPALILNLISSIK